MKTKVGFSGYFRAVVLSVIAAFAILAVINADEVQKAFQSASVRKAIVRMQPTSPGWLRIPEAVAVAAGKVWYAIN